MCQNVSTTTITLSCKHCYRPLEADYKPTLRGQKDRLVAPRHACPGNCSNHGECILVRFSNPRVSLLLLMLNDLLNQHGCSESTVCAGESARTVLYAPPDCIISVCFCRTLSKMTKQTRPSSDRFAFVTPDGDEMVPFPVRRRTRICVQICKSSQAPNIAALCILLPSAAVPLLTCSRRMALSVCTPQVSGQRQVHHRLLPLQATILGRRLWQVGYAFIFAASSSRSGNTAVAFPFASVSG